MLSIERGGARGGAVIQDVDESIRRLIVAELAKAGNALIKDESQVVLGLPSEDGKDKRPRVYLYLHDIRENLPLRDETFHVKRQGNDWSSSKRPGSIRMDLSYLLTVAAEDPLTEHRLLGDLLAVLIRSQSVPDKYLSESLRSENPNALLLTVAQPDHPAHSDPPKLWQSIGSSLRPTLGIVATAKFNPYETAFVKVVREAIFALGQGIHPEGPNRQMDVKSVRLSAAGIVSFEGAGVPNVNVSVEGRSEQALTDDRGFFFFTNLPPDRYRLRFARAGFREAEMETVAPPPGRSDALEPMDVSLLRIEDAEREKQERASREAMQRAASFVEAHRRVTVSLVGTLRFPDGSPAAFVPIRVGGRTAVTDETGAYHFTGLVPGEHEIVAEIPGRGEVPVLPANGAAVLPEGDANGKRAKQKA